MPPTLRTGRLPGETPQALSGTARRPAAVLVPSPAPRSWRGLVRLGLVSLVAAEELVAAPARPLAETLALDAGSCQASLGSSLAGHHGSSVIGQSRMAKSQRLA